MKAIIMAGGDGTRLKAVSGDTPKPMVLLDGKPVLEHIVSLLHRCGMDEITMSLRYRPDLIMSHFGDGHTFGVKINYHVETTPLGTAGGVKACLRPGDDRDFLVISGDCICDFDLRQLAEAHHRHRAAVTIALKESAAPLRYGVVLTDPFGRVAAFAEKPQWGRVISDTVNTGIYIISPKAMELVPDDTAFDFAGDLFPRLLERKAPIHAISMQGYWSDIGTPRAYFETCLDALDGRIDLYGSKKSESCAAPRVERRLHCANRAHLMRLVSQTLMEAGADFTDGVRLSQNGEDVHICPCEDDSSIIITASRSETADEYEALVKKLNQEQANALISR